MFQKPDIHIIFDEVPNRPRHKLIDYKSREFRFPTYRTEEDVKGTAEICLKGSKLEHKGIQVSLIGEIIKVGSKKGGKRFLALQSELDSPGVIVGEKQTYNWKFQRVNMSFESFKGDYITVKYCVRIKILSLKDIIEESEFTVVNPQDQKVLDEDKESINLCVGIQDMLKLSIDFYHKRYNYRGIMEGKVTFHQVGMPLTFMELQIIKRENLEKEDENPPSTMAKHQLMDGSPIRNETVPIRLFLKPFDLTPTYESVNNQFSVRYYINLVLEDNEQNRFFKQKEVIFYRIKKIKKPIDEPGLLTQIGAPDEDLKVEPSSSQDKPLDEPIQDNIPQEETKQDDNIPQSYDENQNYEGQNNDEQQQQQGDFVENVISS